MTRGLQTDSSSIHWAQLSKVHLKKKKKIELSFRNIVFQIKDRTMDNVLNCDSYINKMNWRKSFEAVSVRLLVTLDRVDILVSPENVIR
jgi:hypothetical protein